MRKNSFGKKIAVVLFTAVFAAGAFAQESKKFVDVKTIVPTSLYDELMSKGSILKNSDGANGFLLLPETYYSDKVKESAVIKEDGNFPFVYEGLYYLNKADILKASNSTKKEITIDDVARVCRSVSKMQGMEYFSHRRNKYRVLYERCYMIDEKDLDKKNPDPIPDQNTGNADGQVSYCFQDDSSFGANKYKLSYHQHDNELFTQFVLMDKMGAGPFNALIQEK